MTTLKNTCKFFFPGEFNKFFRKIEDAFDKDSKRDKQKVYLQLKKEFNELKKNKRNSCKNSNKNSIEKKIDVLSLLLVVLEYDIDINETNMVSIYHELDGVEKELDKLNISINTVDKGEKLLRKKIKEIYDKIKFTTNVDLLIKNSTEKLKNEEKDKKQSSNLRNNLQKRLNKLKEPISGGKRNKTRKTKKISFK